MKLIMVRGLPGSGKTTLAKKMAKGLNTSHLEADQYFEFGDKFLFKAEWLKQAHQRCFRLTKAVLDAGHNVVVANTFTRVWEMQHYLDLAEHNLMIDVAVVKCIGNYDSIHDVPAHVYDRMETRWEPYEHESIYNG